MHALPGTLVARAEEESDWMVSTPTQHLRLLAAFATQLVKLKIVVTLLDTGSALIPTKSSHLTQCCESSSLLERYLGETIRIGTFCSYTPDPRLLVSWQF